MKPLTGIYLIRGVTANGYNNFDVVRYHYFCTSY